ncbi:MAG: NADH-quinone oxidoreductase subunit NuoK [Planctomycetales bacterium]|nr:NADH-quinone oxidoreductase subunit NuoK [Planctomycetales bacterium]
MPSSEVALLQNYLIVGAIVFGIGLLGFLARRNLIVMFLSAEMMLQGVSISLVAWSRYHNDWGGQLLVIFIITVAACEAAIALALVLMLFRRSGKLDAAIWNASREENIAEFKDIEIPEDREETSRFPHLTPAGRRPLVDEESQLYRPRV